MHFFETLFRCIISCRVGRVCKCFLSSSLVTSSRLKFPSRATSWAERKTQKSTDRENFSKKSFSFCRCRSISDSVFLLFSSSVSAGPGEDAGLEIRTVMFLQGQQTIYNLEVEKMFSVKCLFLFCLISLFWHWVWAIHRCFWIDVYFMFTI